jgi:error-prone DNA polymerase
MGVSRNATGAGAPRQIVTPGEHAERVRKREYRRGAAASSGPGLPYVELRAASAFSFLDAASLPEDLMERAAALDLPSVALIDRNGVYGAPRFYKAAQQAGVRALVGAEISLATADPRHPAMTSPLPRSSDTHVRRAAALALPRVSVLVENRAGYKNLCRLLTLSAAGKAKGEAYATWDQLAAHADGLWCLSGGDESVAARWAEHPQELRGNVERLASIFDRRLHLELQRHNVRGEEQRNGALCDVAARLRLPLVATNGVRYARVADKEMHDVLTAIRHRTPLDRAGTLLAAQRERHLKSAAEMARLFADRPRAVAESAALAERLSFTLADLGYRFPDFPVPAGETLMSYLRELTWNGARQRFRPLTARAQAQIERELTLIDKLDLAGYFLIVWEIVDFCRKRSIIVQGRGSAANSAVCYALSITAVDPVKMELLFERFLSEERGEWPDIDLDLPSGDDREAAIQHVYKLYGGDGGSGAAMTANVITYRDRSAAREAAKALGFANDQIDLLAKHLGGWGYDRARGDQKVFAQEMTAAGFDPADERILVFQRAWDRLQNLPRHLGQHSGGMVIAAGRLDDVVPLEPAAMPNRTVVQWDKDDCNDLGLIKVDLLGLGMLNAIAEMIPMIRTHENTEVDLAHLPADDPATYAQIRAADTVGVFQIESRAQMASLPRHAPTKFYDLVVQVAIIRPGPIVGGMVHPFFERRLGREAVVYPHPSLEPVLKRTLGVPLFQEQLLKIAMTVAGFTGGEAEELRRAMGFKRSQERMCKIEERLRAGMSERGIDGAMQDQIVQSITSFALYGFPESHAASFALIAYASAWLRCHHPTAFTACLLNAWPMGFYHPATLVQDAKRHGVEVRPIDVNRSDWKCTWEENATKRTDPAKNQAAGAIRLGLRYVRGLRQERGERIATERALRRFTDLEDLKRRTEVKSDELTALAEGGSLASLGLTRRAALWQAAWIGRSVGPLLSAVSGLGDREGRDDDSASPSRSPKPGTARREHPLPEMTPFEETLADFARNDLTVNRHPVSYVRAQLDRHSVLPAGRVAAVPNGERVRTAGSVIVRQRPGTAKGTLFLTLEDESGMIQAIVAPELYRENRKIIVGSAGLVVEGKVTQRDGSISIRAEKFWPLSALVEVPSHDFH